MKVDKSQFNENKRYLEKLVDSQRNEIASRQTEIENIKDYYNKKIDQSKLDNEVALLNVRDRNQAELIEASSHQEERLNELKKNLVQTQENLEKQKRNLSTEHDHQIENMNRDHALKTKDIFDRSRTQMQDINFEANSQIKKVRSDSEQSIQKIEHDTKMELNKASFDAGLKVSQAQNHQAKSMKDNEARFRQQLKKNEAEHKTRVAEETFKNQIEFSNRQRIFQDKNEALDKHHQDLLLSEKKAFETKYAKAVQDHQSILKELENKLNKEMMSAIKSNAEQKDFIEFKAHDPFYSLKTLESNMREDDSAYYLDIPTPEHERDNYVVTAHKRKIKISFSRRSEERIDGEKGSVHASRRSESLTKEFNVDKILDSKKVTTAYNDGILTFKIVKA